MSVIRRLLTRNNQKVCQSEGKYIRQSGGKGQYGHCWIEIEPKERGTGYEFVNKIVGGVIPKEYIRRLTQVSKVP